MQIVMPSVIRHSAQQPYKAMARFETGTLGGNLHAHGFSYGSDAPRMPRRDRANPAEQGDESSDVGSENEDGCDRDEKVGGGGNEGRSDPAVRGESLDSDGGFSPIGGEDERSLEGSGTMQGSIHSRDEFRDGQNGLKGSVQSAIERRDFRESFSLDDLICSVLGDARVDEDLCSLRSLVDGMVDEGVLESFPDGCLKRVPPVPKHER